MDTTSDRDLFLVEVVASILDELGILVDKVRERDGDMELVRVGVWLRRGVLSARDSPESFDGFRSVLIILLCAGTWLARVGMR